VNIDLKQVDIPSILSSIVQYEREHTLFQESFDRIERAIKQMYREEYETWELINYLTLADTVYFEK
jgi:hypothetical protein